MLLTISGEWRFKTQIALARALREERLVRRVTLQGTSLDVQTEKTVVVEVIRRQRKSPILTPSTIPCLRQLPTLNITQGCALGCTYCYTRGYPDYPGPNRILLFENTAELVSSELARKRRKPQRVYFSPSSDAFQYLPAVQQVTFETMRVLLEAGVEVAFLTKGFVRERFRVLFKKHARLVFAQIGISSLRRDIWRILEPRTAPPDQRLEILQSLSDIGCQVTARLDPLIPDVTDTEPEVDSLLHELGKAGATYAAASYLFLRAGFGESLLAQLRGLNSSLGQDSWVYQRFTAGCSGGRTIEEDDRRIRFERLAEIGRRHGITVAPCACKNPTLGTGTCQIAGASHHPPVTAQTADQQQMLF